MAHASRIRRAVGTAAATALVLSLGPGVAGVGTGQAVTGTGWSGPPPRPLGSVAGCPRALRFDAAQFPAVPRIDNQYLPFTPGTQLVLEGVSSVTNPTAPHTVTFTVTDLVKTINGVPSLVVHDVDESDGTVTEAELSFFAQDLSGNVWNLGEYPEEYENGEFAGAPSTWIAGQRRAEAGLHMLAEPVVGGSEYLQGWSPTIRFLDCAGVIAAGESVELSNGGRYSGVLVTNERNPLERSSGSQQKYHAPGIGIVKVGFQDDPQGEVLELSEHVSLDDAALAAVRESALELDARAYEEAARVYEATSAATPLPGPGS